MPAASSERPPSPRAAAIAALVASFAAAMLASPVTRATHVEPTQPTTIVVGPPPGIAPMGRVGGGRAGRAHDPLPDRPKVLWRHANSGGLDFVPLAVDARGAVIVPSASVPEVSQLSAAGVEMWRASTGRGPAVSGAVILGNDTRLVTTSAGEVVRVSPDGKRRLVTQLGLQDHNSRVGILPLDDGGAAIGGGHEVDDIDADGNVRQRTRLPERTTGPLVATLAGTVATSPSGTAYLVGAGYAKRVGTFGGDPSESGASTADGHTLWAVIDHQKIVALDVTTGVARIHFAVTDQSLHGPVVFGRNDTLVITTWTGVLLSLSATGQDVRRVALEPRFASLVTDAGKVDFAALDESPPPITDHEGRTGFARVGGRIGVVLADGTVSSVAGPTCSSPAALSPAGLRRMVVGCRDGTVFMLGDDVP